jgi:hypothetical protein
LESVDDKPQLIDLRFAYGNKANGVRILWTRFISFDCSVMRRQATLKFANQVWDNDFILAVVCMFSDGHGSPCFGEYKYEHA